MTVPTLNSVAEFSTNGVTTNFPFFFKFLANEDLVVTYVSPAGVSTVLTYGLQYTVNGAGDEDGGSVVTTTALAGPGQLIVSREMDAYQQTSLRNQGKFLAETHEDVFDRLTMLIQQGFSIFKRALVRPFGRDYYDAENRRIANLADPIELQDATPKGWVSRFVGDLIAAIQGPINNAANIFYQAPDGTAHVVQDLSGADGADLIGHGTGTVADTLRALEADYVSVADFGILPDGVTNWESSPSADWAGLKAAAITTGVRWPAGKTDAEYYACGINFDKTWDGARMHFEPGSVLGGVFHLISGPDAANQYALSSAVRASNVVTLVTSSAHGFVTGDRIQVRRTFQTYIAGIATMDTDDAVCTVVNSTTLTYPSVGPNGSATISGLPFGPAFVNNSPLMNVHISGKLTTTDRLGSINCKNCYIEHCHVLNDPARHSAYPGTGARGAHLYVGTDGLRVGELVIDYATGANTAAAFALDGNAWNPSNCSFGRIHIKDSAYNGAYITGGGHTFGELRIDGFAKEAPNGETLQDSDGQAQTEEFKGFWANRCWGTTIDRLITGQRVQDGTRGYENAQALIDQTGHPSYGTTLNSGITITSWTATNVRRNGLRFGDFSTYNSLTCVCDIGSLEVRAAPEGVLVGGYLVDCQGASLLTAINFGVIRLIGTGVNLGVRTSNLSNVGIGSLIGLDHANQLLQVAGRVTVGSIYGRTGSSSVPTKPIVNIVGSGGASYGSRIGNIDVQSTIAKATQAFLSDGNAGKWVVGSIRSQGYVPTTGAVYIDNPTLGWSIENLDLAGTGSTGVGVGFNGTIAAGKLGGGRVTGFATGFAKGTATFTAASNAAIAVQSVGNTTATDLLAASFDKLACVGVTL